MSMGKKGIEAFRAQMNDHFVGKGETAYLRITVLDNRDFGLGLYTVVHT